MEDSCCGLISWSIGCICSFRLKIIFDPNLSERNSRRSLGLGVAAEGSHAVLSALRVKSLFLLWKRLGSSFAHRGSEVSLGLACVSLLGRAGCLEPFQPGLSHPSILGHFPILHIW